MTDRTELPVSAATMEAAATASVEATAATVETATTTVERASAAKAADAASSTAKAAGAGSATKGVAAPDKPMSRSTVSAAYAATGIGSATTVIAMSTVIAVTTVGISTAITVTASIAPAAAIAITAPAVMPAPTVPRSGADKHAAREPARTVISIGRASIWVIRVIAPIADRRAVIISIGIGHNRRPNSYSNRDLSICFSGEGQSDKQSEQ